MNTMFSFFFDNPESKTSRFHFERCQSNVGFFDSIIYNMGRDLFFFGFIDKPSQCWVAINFMAALEP